MGADGRGNHTSFELELPAQNIHQELDHSVHRGQGIGEQEESNHDRIFIVETKRLIQGLVVHENREQGEDVEHVELL